MLADAVGLSRQDCRHATGRYLDERRPGSGKSTLAQAPSGRLRLLWSTKMSYATPPCSRPAPTIFALPLGRGLWYRVLESLLDLGVSVIGDMTLFPGGSEPDVCHRSSSKA